MPFEKLKSVTNKYKFLFSYLSSPVVFVPLVIFTCALYMLWPIMSRPWSSWYLATQAYRYPYLLEWFKQSFISGNLYPRWLPELYGGYGYPTFIYYPPGFWFASLPYAAFFSPTAAVRLTILTMFSIGGLGTYFLARYFNIRVFYALTCSILYLTTPYFAFITYLRGNFAEITGMVLIPWLLLTFFYVCDAVKEKKPLLLRVSLLGFTYALMFYGHPFAAFWITPVLIIMAFLELVLSKKRLVILMSFAAAALIAASLTSPFWFNLITMKYDSRYHMIHLGNLWLVDSFRELSYYVNWFVLALSMLGCMFMAKMQKHAISIHASMLVMLFMVSAASEVVWLNSELLGKTQISTRIFSAFTTLQIIGIIFLFRYLQKLPKNFPRLRFPQLYVVVVAIVLVVCSIFYTQKYIGPDKWPSTFATRYLLRDYERLQKIGWWRYERFRYNSHSRFENMTHLNEFLPRFAKIEDLQARPPQKIPIALSNVKDAIVKMEGRGDNIKIWVKSPANITFNQFWFPGWALEINGKRVPTMHAVYHKRRDAEMFVPLSPIKLDNNGRMTIALRRKSEDPVSIRLWYEGPPYWKERNIAALSVLVLTCALLYFGDKGGFSRLSFSLPWMRRR